MSTSMLSYVDKITEATNFIRSQLPIQQLQPRFACILGSGLGDLADQLTDSTAISFAEIPHFADSTVIGHAGRLVLGWLDGHAVLMMQGRFHYYEGHSMRAVVLPLYVFKSLGIHSVIVTNAAGGMNRLFRPGDLMVIADHLNMTGDNPLIGENLTEFGVRFPDMSQAYDATYHKLALELGQAQFAEQTLQIHSGVYAGISGPTYMTPAELIMLARCGADAVGMSTVAEVIAARHAGLRVLGISCITDLAIGEELKPLTHEQVVAVANRTKPLFQLLVRTFLREAHRI